MNPEQDGSHEDSVWKHIGLETNAVWFSEPFFFQEGADAFGIHRIGL